MSTKTFYFRLLFVAITTVTLAGCGSGESTSDSKKEKARTQAQARQDIATVKIVSRNLQKQIRIPGELLSFRNVPIYPKVQGFIKAISVDRGSTVKAGQLLMQIDAPELKAQYGEAEGRLEAARSALLEMQPKIDFSLAQQKEAEAKAASAEAVYKRIQHAAKTPGAVAETDLDEAQQKVAQYRAHVQALAQSVEAARSQLKAERGKVKAAEQALSSISEMRAYLTITAPFDGVITERNVHEGALVSSESSAKPMLRIQQTSILRLLVPVPESAIAGMRPGMALSFTVPAFTGKLFSATVQRVGHALDIKTRTMPVEADVQNSGGELEPGMYPEVVWEMQRPYKTMFVPSQAVASNADSTFVIAIRNGLAKRVEVTCGQSMGDLLEVMGNLQTGDEVALKASEELKEDTQVSAHQTPLNKIPMMSKKAPEE